jgi:hypothetical protein
MTVSPQPKHRIVMTKRLGIKIGAVLLLAVIAVSAVFLTSLGNYGAAGPQTLSGNLSAEEEKGLRFIEEVLCIDLSEYNVSINAHGDVPPPSFATPEQIALAPSFIDYNFNASGSAVKIICSFIKGTLTHCSMNVEEGTAASRQVYSNLTEAVKGFLLRYQDFSGQNAAEMIETLANVDPAKDTTVMRGDLKLTVTHKDLSGTFFGDSTDFCWVYTYSGCDYPAITVDFKDGVFSGFSDKRGVYSIGDTTVNISMAQAREIALSEVKNYSYEFRKDVWISGFGVNGTSAHLYPQTRNSTCLYPCWSVVVLLDKTYPGSVSALVVFVWADSGEAFGIGSTWVPGYGEPCGE